MSLKWFGCPRAAVRAVHGSSTRGTCVFLRERCCCSEEALLFHSHWTPPERCTCLLSSASHWVTWAQIPPPIPSLQSPSPRCWFWAGTGPSRDNPGLLYREALVTGNVIQIKFIMSYTPTHTQPWPLNPVSLQQSKDTTGKRGSLQETSIGFFDFWHEFNILPHSSSADLFQGITLCEDRA